MFKRQVFSFLKNVLIFLVDRLYKEWGYVLGNGRSYSERASERGDLYAKQIIENIIHDRATKYDPYVLNENTAITYGTASVVLGKAHVTGLSTLHRTNICSLTEEGNRLFVTANLGAGPLTYHRQIVFRFWDFEQKAAILASLINIKVSLDFSVEKKTGRDGFLLNFAINELNGFKLSVNGSVYFDWIINLFFSFWTLVLGKILRNLLENELEKYILNRLPKYQFPVEGSAYLFGTKLKNQHEGQNSGTSFLESSCMQQNHKTPKWSKISPISNSVRDGHNSVEDRTVKDFGSNPGVTKTSRCFQETTSKLTTEMNNSDLLEQNLDFCSESSNENSNNEVSKDESEKKFDRIYEISRKTRQISNSLNVMAKKLDWVNNMTNSWSKEVSLPNCLNILDDFSLLDRNIPEKSDSQEPEYYSSESTDSVTSPLSRSYENKQGFQNCETIGELKNSETEYFSEMLQVPYKDQTEKSFEDTEKNFRQSQLLEEIFSEIHQRSCKNNVDGNAIDMGIELPATVDNCDSSTSTKLEFSHKGNVFETSSRETGTFRNISQNLDSERRKSQIEYLERMFNGKKRKREYSSENQSSVESCTHCQSPERSFSDQNFDLKLCSAEMLKNEPLISCTINEFKKHLNASADVFSQEHECKIKNTESKCHHFNKFFPRNQGVETSEIQQVSNSKDKVDGLNLYMSNLISGIRKRKLILDKKSDLEPDNEMISIGIRFSEKHENDANEKIPNNYTKIYSGEELNEDSQFEANEGYSADNSSTCEELISFEGKCDPLTEISINAMETSRLPKTTRGKLDPPYHETNLRSQGRSLLDELECLDKRQTECRDSTAEFPLIAGLKLNENSNENSFEEIPHRKLLHDLQEKIIAQTRKLVSDQESCEYSGCPILRKDIGYQKDKSTYNEAIRVLNEVNQFLRRDSEKDLDGGALQNREFPNLSRTRHSPIDYENLGYFSYPTDWETEASETYNEQKPESDTH